MTKLLKKLFGGLNLTWPKLIIAAILAGVCTAAMAIIPALHYTSFITITTTFEVWILFGILIIMNSRSNLDAGLKCFVFYLISRPPVYSTEIMANGEKYSFDGSYSVSLEDSRFGSVEIVRPEQIGDYMVHAEFKKAGKTVLTLRAPDGAETKYDLRIERDKYEITKR